MSAPLPDVLQARFQELIEEGLRQPFVAHRFSLVLVALFEYLRSEILGTRAIRVVLSRHQMKLRRRSF
ncbi:hypothetical protein [Roseibium sp.]|uniref:hypothetical protein n=1 Tax=Roseibium sp. TaxID=1936156 RepID=UPI003B50A2C1